MRFQETVIGRLGKALHAHWDDIAHEPLPRRWIELIQHLNEQEESDQSGNQDLKRADSDVRGRTRSDLIEDVRD